MEDTFNVIHIRFNGLDLRFSSFVELTVEPHKDTGEDKTEQSEESVERG